MITLATLEAATAQEVFDQVASHMMRQKERSMLEDSVCAYRGKEGLKCAAGCLISDEEIQLFSFESTGLNTLPWTCLINRGIATDNHRSLISELQTIHDSPYNLPKEDWANKLRTLAGQRGLSYSVVHEPYGN